MAEPVVPVSRKMRGRAAESFDAAQEQRALPGASQFASSATFCNTTDDQYRPVNVPCGMYPPTKRPHNGRRSGGEPRQAVIASLSQFPQPAILSLGEAANRHRPPGCVMGLSAGGIGVGHPTEAGRFVRRGKPAESDPFRHLHATRFRAHPSGTTPQSGSPATRHAATSRSSTCRSRTPGALPGSANSTDRSMHWLLRLGGSQDGLCRPR